MHSSGKLNSYQTSGGSTEAILAVSTTGSGCGFPICKIKGKFKKNRDLPGHPTQTVSYDLALIWIANAFV